jgi:hypothetical protein
MTMKINSRMRVMCKLMTCVMLLLPFASIARAAVGISFGAAGLQSLEYNGVQYLNDGRCLLGRVDFVGANDARVNVNSGVLRHSIGGGGARYWITSVYQWGTMTCGYSLSGDRLRITVEVLNNTAYTIHRMIIRLIILAAPSGPPSVLRSLFNTKANLDGPEVFPVSYGATKLWLVNDQPMQLLNMVPVVRGGGLTILLDSVVTPVLLPIQIFGSPNASRRTPLRRTELSRAISPGQSDRFAVSLRFTSATTRPQGVLHEVLAPYAAQSPATLNWPDRRPIGALGLAVRGPSTPFNPGNPHYWRFIKPGVDVNSPSGRAQFRTLLLQEADTAVANLRRMNAQGVVLWSLEGDEYPPQVTYVGDPRVLPAEMQGVVDQFFKRFTDAGLRCGVTLRPQKFVRPQTGEAYQLQSDDPATIFTTLEEKIQYAHRRWGCTLFYIDSNGDMNWPMQADVFRKLAARHPDVLLMPESKTLAYFAWTAPFCDLRTTCPFAQARLIYPKAFDVIQISAVPLTRSGATWADLVRRVREGDVLMTQTWWSDPHIAAVSEIYQEASRME